MSWTFVYLMVVLKIPIVGLLWICWWAIHNTEEPAPAADEDGGIKRPLHPRPPRPRPRPRGPHGEPAVASPPRVRTAVAARARDSGRR